MSNVYGHPGKAGGFLNFVLKGSMSGHTMQTPMHYDVRSITMVDMNRNSSPRICRRSSQKRPVEPCCWISNSSRNRGKKYSTGIERSLKNFCCNTINTRSKEGFTLLELVITVAIIAILTGIGTPSFRNIILNSRATAAADGLVSAIQLSRSESAKRLADVKICRADSSATGCADDTNWSNGWLVCASPCNNAALVIRAWGSPASVTTLTSTSASGITFHGNGLGSTSANFYIAFGGTQEQRCVSVTQSGRIVVKRTACS